ncbi:hypothetical protein N665_0624s0020 [Sinapis alba]|nr:hypothetical protein N665_0624s0020 [Sinapis alba]
MLLFGGTVVSLVTVLDLSAWKISFDSNLFAAAYSGVICSGVAYYVQGVVMRERGPVFVATFNPLCVVITAALGVVVLSESIHLGSILLNCFQCVIGTIFIIVGLYTVVWGKGKDKRMSDNDEISKGLPVKSPVKSPVKPDLRAKDGQETNKATQLEI